MRRVGVAANLPLLLLPGRIQEQVPVPVLFGLHVVVGLLGIIMVHDGARVLGAGFFFFFLHLLSRRRQLLPGRGEGVGRAGLGWAGGAGLAPLSPLPPRLC